MKKIDKRKYKHSYDYVEKTLKQIEKYCKLPESEIKYYELKKLWNTLFTKYLEYWGWNKPAIKTMFWFGQTGHNWELLWFPTTEKDSRTKTNDYLKQYDFKTLKAALDSFSGEIWYCSDRMSMDRLLRIHWEYNALCVKWFHEEVFNDND